MSNFNLCQSGDFSSLDSGFKNRVGIVAIYLLDLKMMNGIGYISKLTGFPRLSLSIIPVVHKFTYKLSQFPVSISKNSEMGRVFHLTWIVGSKYILSKISFSIK